MARALRFLGRHRRLSGTGKTPGISVSTRALRFIEKGQEEEITALRRAHETRIEGAKAAQKKWKKEVEEAVEAGTKPPQQPANADNPGPFVRPRIWVSDVTIERLAVLLQARPSGMIVISDELSGWFSNMSRYSNGDDRQFWLEAWNGNAYVVERMGREPVPLDHLLVAVVGGLQPDKLRRSFEGDDDGMYARIGFSWPSEPEYRPLSRDALETDPVLINAFGRLIKDLPVKTEEGSFSRPRSASQTKRRRPSRTSGVFI